MTPANGMLSVGQRPQPRQRGDSEVDLLLLARQCGQPAGTGESWSCTRLRLWTACDGRLLFVLKGQPGDGQLLLSWCSFALTGDSFDAFTFVLAPLYLRFVEIFFPSVALLRRQGAGGESHTVTMQSILPGILWQDRSTSLGEEQITGTELTHFKNDAKLPL